MGEEVGGKASERERREDREKGRGWGVSACSSVSPNRVQSWSWWSRASSLPPSLGKLNHNRAYYRITRWSLRCQVWKGINMVAIDPCPSVGARTRFSLTVHLSILEMCGVGYCWYTYHVLLPCLILGVYRWIWWESSWRKIVSPFLFCIWNSRISHFCPGCKNKRGKILFSK